MVSGWPEKKPKRTPQIMPETRDSKLAMLLRVASPKKQKTIIIGRVKRVQVLRGPDVPTNA